MSQQEIISFNFPPQCCRCNTRFGNRRLKLTFIGSNLGFNVTAEIGVPICDTCLAEHGARKRRRWRVGGILAIVSIALWIIFALINSAWNELSTAMKATGVFLSLFAGMTSFSTFLFAMFNLARWHSQNGIGAIDVGARTIRFGNRNYQRSFDALNGKRELFDLMVRHGESVRV